LGPTPASTNTGSPSSPIPHPAEVHTLSTTFENLRTTIALRIPAMPITHSDLMPITHSGLMPITSERSDAGLFHDPRVIGISQSF